MSMGQMLTVLLAVILFSTIVITMYNNMFSQIALAEDKIYYTQAIKVSDLVFQQFEIEMVSDRTSFEDLYEKFKNPVKTDSLVFSNLDVVFSYIVSSVYSDESGNVKNEVSDHQKLTVDIEGIIRGEKKFLGSYDKVFSDMSIGG